MFVLFRFIISKTRTTYDSNVLVIKGSFYFSLKCFSETFFRPDEYLTNAWHTRGDARTPSCKVCPLQLYDFDLISECVDKLEKFSTSNSSGSQNALHADIRTNMANVMSAFEFPVTNGTKIV
jgi:hypothetical protein